VFESYEEFRLGADDEVARGVLLVQEVESQHESVVVDRLVDRGGAVGECVEARACFIECERVGEVVVMWSP
jgi:hypothetical protein